MWSLWWLSAGPSTDKPCQWQSNLTCPRCAFFFMAISWFSSRWWSLYGYPIILICFNVSIKAKVTTGLWWSVVDFFQFTYAYNYDKHTLFVARMVHQGLVWNTPPPTHTHLNSFRNLLKILSLASWRQYVYSVTKID